MAQSEIARRKLEKPHLPPVSQAVTSIRDQQDLFRMLVARIKPILGFEVGAQILTADLADGSRSLNNTSNQSHTYRNCHTHQGDFPDIS